MADGIAQKTVAGKLRKWYPLPHQRKHRLVVRLQRHMEDCEVCSDPRQTICDYAADVLREADIKLGLRKV